MNIAIYLAIFLFGPVCYSLSEKRKRVVEDAKYHGILINRVHYKVYKIYRSPSYTDGGWYIQHHDVKYFGEVMLVSPEGQKLYVSESHLRHCLRTRYHKNQKTKINGKMTNWWPEWRIDPNGDDEYLKKNDIYSWMY